LFASPSVGRSLSSLHILAFSFSFCARYSLSLFCQKVTQFARGFYALQELGFNASVCRTSLANCANDRQRAAVYAGQLQSFCAQGHAATDVVVAIDFFPSDETMAGKFLDGLRVLRSMGFPDEKVQHALIANGCDTERALATLGVQ
jgi:hypothetical protein